MLTGMGIPIEDRITGSGSKGTITMGNGKTDPETDLTPETGKEQQPGREQDLRIGLIIRVQ